VIFRNCYTKFHEPLSEWNLRQFWNIVNGIYAKYHVQIMLLIVHTTTSKRFVIFPRRYFKLSWNTTALSQSNCRKFSCNSINTSNTDWIILACAMDRTKLVKSICETWLKSLLWAPNLYMYQDLIMCHDCLVNSHRRFANQVERKFEKHFW